MHYRIGQCDMPIPPELQDVYRQFWSITQAAAMAKDDAGGYIYRSNELITAVSEALAAQGQTASFQTYSQLPALFAMARASDRANTNLFSAGAESEITSSMVSQWPTAAPVSVQDAQPEYMAKAQFTYTNQIGEISTGWVTLTGITQLPPSVGNLSLRLQGAAMQNYTQTPDEGGTPKTDAEVMAEFGEFTELQLYAV